MNIVVCVKYVPDAQADRTFVESDKTTDRVGVDGLLSELDEYAIEEALLVTEAGEGEVTVLTVGPEQATDALKKALQMGADKAVHVVDDADPRLGRPRDVGRSSPRRSASWTRSPTSS